MACEMCPHCIAQEFERKSNENQMAQMARVAQIVSTVSARYRVTPEQIMEHRRFQAFSWARHVAFYLARESTSLSFPAIGKYFNRDHSTVIHGWNVVRERMAERPMFASEVRRLMEERAQ